MYEEHRDVKTPQRDAVLWRYMDFEKFVSLLDRHALFFTKTSQLGDPFEGSITKSNQNWIDREFTNPENFHTFLIERRNHMLVNCWHEDDYESAAMWSLYGERIAIRTTCARLCQSLICDQPIHVGRVRYVDYNKIDMPMKNLLEFYLLKRLSFKHEQEVRAITSTPDPMVESEGTYYEVNLEILLEQVVIAPDSPKWFMDLVKSVSKRYNVEVPILQSNLEDDPLF